MNIHAQKGALEEASCDLLLAMHFEDAKSFVGSLKTADTALDGYLTRVFTDEGFEGKIGQSIIVHTHELLSAKRILVVGLGKKKDFTPEQLRRAAGTAITSARTVRAKSMHFSFEGLVSAKLNVEVIAQAFVEGIELASYRFMKYHGKKATEEAEKSDLSEVIVFVDSVVNKKKAQKGIDRGQAYAEGAMYVRDLVNEPAVAVKPKTLAKLAEDLGKKTSGVKTKIYKEADLRKLKMGSFLSVAAGSDEDPYMIHLSYIPKKKRKNTKKIVFCGKGITFDSGGLSLKPSQYMENMKMDMAGAATVLGVFTQMSTLAPNVEVHGVMVVTENMPSGKATRPGDVVTAYNGKTIEVTNTDAEGRLVLADALAWAEKELKPDYIIDLATLTGAAIVALGQEVAAFMGTDTTLLAQVEAAGKETGESLWEMPLVPEYSQLLKSQIADLQNISTVPWAGTIIGGLFLKEFVEKTPWVHIDIAGPAFVEKQVLSYAPMGGSGFGVRLLLKLIDSLK